MLMVANIARYHRKNIPRRHHPDYMRLAEEDRERTNVLSAILRVADALDRAHLQSIEDVAVSSGGASLELRLKGEGDLLLERWAVSRKTNLLSKVFEREVTVSVE
jgi:exopolyphosphatase/guanosine-5'-triphosphate,3'-diphosphate pyrophosphatase